MLRSTKRLVSVLMALGLFAAACSDDADTAASGTADATGSAEATGGDDAAEAASGDTTATAEQTASVEVSGELIGAMPEQVPVTEASNDPFVGVVAPEVIGSDFDGNPVSITADGTPRVVMFVAHWCPHCQREVPAVKALIDQGAVPEGLEIVVVSTAVRDGESNYPPQTWLQNEAWTGPVMRDSADNEVVLAFGAGGFPYTVYIDSEHRVVARSAGELPADILQQLWLATANA